MIMNKSETFSVIVHKVWFNKTAIKKLRAFTLNTSHILIFSTFDHIKIVPSYMLDFLIPTPSILLSTLRILKRSLRRIITN